MEILAQSNATQHSLNGNPYLITIKPGPIDMSKSEVTGIGLTPLATKDVPNDVVAVFKDSYGNSRKANLSMLNMILYTNFATELSNFSFNGINGYVATYTPKSGGLYTIVVSYNNVNFSGVPYNMLISGTARKFPESIMLIVQPKETFVAGETASVYMTTSNFTATIYDLDICVLLDPNPWESITTICAEKVQNFTYSTSLTVTLAGSYKIYVSLFGSIFQTEPQTLVVEPGEVKIWACVPIGSGLTKAVAGFTQQILIKTMDMFGNIAGEKDGAAIDFLIVIARLSIYDYFETFKFSQYSYQGSYTIYEAGSYLLSITCKGVHVHGSPFNLSVSEGSWSYPTISLRDSLAIALEKTPFSFASLQGFQVEYSNMNSLVKVELRVLNGMMVSLTIPNITTSRNDSRSLIIHGTMKLVNDVMRYIQYLGGPGDDYLIMSVSSMEGDLSMMFGVSKLQESKQEKILPIYIRAINHPPTILAPTYVNIESNVVSNISIKLENVIVADVDEFDREAYGEVLQLSITVGADRGLVKMSIGADVAVTASTHNGTAWQPLSQLLSPNASLLLLLLSSAIKFRASVPDCNRALATLEYLSAAPVSPSVHEIARITIIVNDMGNYGCYNDCSTAEPVPLLAVSTIVIANYGWFSHKWLLLRPGVLLGVVVGVGMLLIVMASVCTWLCLVNRLLSARGKVQKVISSFGIADGVLLEVDSQQADNATETSDDGYIQNEVQANQHFENVATIDTYREDGVAMGGASDSISGDGMHDCAQVDVASGGNEASDVITEDDYAQADYPVGADWQCSYFSGGKDLPSEETHTPDLARYATDLLGNSSPTVYLNEEGPSEGVGRDDSDGFTLPCCLKAPDQQILPTSSIYKPEDTCTKNQKYKNVPYELDDPVDKEGMQHLHYSMTSGVGSEEESQESRRSLLRSWGNVLPTSLSSSFVDNCLNQQNVEDDHACEDLCLQSYENQSDYQSSLVEVQATYRSQNEYTNQLDNEMGVGNALLRSIPCGDSYSSSQSSTSTGCNTNLERTLPIEAMTGTHGALEEDRITACEINPASDSYPPEIFDEEMSQMPELKLVLELPEASSLDEAMDPLDHINLVLSSLETDADGSLVAVLKSKH